MTALRLLEADAVSAAPFNVLHVCRERNHLPRLLGGRHDPRYVLYAYGDSSSGTW